MVPGGGGSTYRGWLVPFSCASDRIHSASSFAPSLSTRFVLVGGRMDYLYKRAVAALVYRHGDQVINVFIWPVNRRDDFPARLDADSWDRSHGSAIPRNAADVGGRWPAVLPSAARHAWLGRSSSSARPTRAAA